ncbi:MAG: inorganic phosphate transporter [Syntrophales bacterium]
MEVSVLIMAVLVVALALSFDFSNGFHDAANVVATIIVTGAMSPAMALTIASICEFIGPFLFGTAVAKTIGKNIIDTSAFDPNAMALSAGLIIAALIGAIAWNLVTWWFGLPSSSSHALIGGLIGPVLIAHGPDKVIWKGVLFVFASLILSPLIGMFFGWLFLKITRSIAERRRVTPRVNALFNRMQIVSSVCLALSHGANDAQKSMGVITMTLVILGVFPSFEIPFWVIASCAAAIAAGCATGGWRIIRTMGSQICRLRSIHAFCAQTASATVILTAALFGGPVSTTHVVSSSIIGVGAGQRLSAVRWTVAKDIIMAWFITIPASAVVAGAVFYAIKAIHPGF